MQIQKLTESIDEVAHGMRRDGFQQIESFKSCIQKLLESWIEYLNETDLAEMLISHSIEKETSTTIEVETSTLKNFRECLRMVNEVLSYTYRN